MSEECAICGAAAATPADLVIHTRTAHKNDDPTSSMEMNPEAHTIGLVCALCGHRFPNAAALAAHNLQPHPAPRETEGPMAVDA